MGFLVGEIKKVDSAIFKAPENELAKKTAALANKRRKQAESEFRRQTARDDTYVAHRKTLAPLRGKTDEKQTENDQN